MTLPLTPAQLDALLDPGIAPAVRQMEAAVTTPAHLLTPAQVRQAWEAARKPLQRGPHALHIEDRLIATPTPLQTRVYRPPAAAGAALAAMVYFHGGGFTNGDLDSQDAACCAMASRTGALVLSVNYRKLPQHPFPAAFDDAVAAVDWLARHADGLGAASSWAPAETARAPTWPPPPRWPCAARSRSRRSGWPTRFWAPTSRPCPTGPMRTRPC
jgi:acetyl esterase/lipase